MGDGGVCVCVLGVDGKGAGAVWVLKWVGKGLSVDRGGCWEFAWVVERCGDRRGGV